MKQLLNQGNKSRQDQMESLMTSVSRLGKVGALALLTGFMSIAPAFAKDVKIGVLMPRTDATPKAA